jgi:regulation of enolase protein 1 (concanavalin A-like superfamily)
MTDIAWAEGRWTTEPEHVVASDGGLFVTAKEGSDAWRTTAYGFIHDTEHALLAPIEEGQAVEVSFRVELPEQFDQAGVFLKVDDETWIKAGVERSDGEASLGAVVTRRESDWSLSPVPTWVGRVATVRASWSAGAVTIRARVDDEPWRLVRVAPLPAGAHLEAGPFCCAPSRAGLTVHFLGWRLTEGDAALHPDTAGTVDSK